MTDFNLNQLKSDNGECLFVTDRKQYFEARVITAANNKKDKFCIAVQLDKFTTKHVTCNPDGSAVKEGKLRGKVLNKNPHSASDAIKRYGLSSIEEVCRLTDISRKTMSNWFKSRPKLFHVVAVGSLEIKNQKGKR